MSDTAPIPLLPPPDPTYARLAHAWWTYALVVTLVPLNLIIFSNALGPEPPPYDSFRIQWIAALSLAAVFLIGSLILYLRYRRALPAVVDPRMWGPKSEAGRRLGFWACWSLIGLLNWGLLGVLGPLALSMILVNGPSSYLRPDAAGLTVELLDDGAKTGLVHLILHNASHYPLPTTPGMPLGALTIETPAGPYLLGRASWQVPVTLTEEQLPLRPLPAAFAPATDYTFLVPYPRLGQVLESAPPGLEVRITFTPQRSQQFTYQPLDLFEGPLRSLPLDPAPDSATNPP